MRMGIAQCNPTIGDFKGNCQLVEDALKTCQNENPDMLIFSELFLTGYPPRDLLERRDFISAAENALKEVQTLSRAFPGTGILIGTVRPTQEKTGIGLYNCAVLIENGELLFQQNKMLLPAYDVFDETRYFDAATRQTVFPYKDEILAITICEDAWNRSELLPKGKYATDPIEQLQAQHPTLYLNLSASPFHVGKPVIRKSLIATLAKKLQKPFVLVNQIGGHDELIFDGNSLAFDHTGNCIDQAPAFKPSIHVTEIKNATPIPSFNAHDMEDVLNALTLGVKDYLQRCGFSKAMIGLSGGIDSAVVCAIAVRALGQENVLGIAMPSQYSSSGSVVDAQALAENLGIRFKIIPIEDFRHVYDEQLTPHFEGKESDVTEENIQARIRGNILMAFSNKFGYLTLSTGNKSELSVGYCTLYGDMSGGLSVIADLPKTMVYALAEYINRDREIIPSEIIHKPPSAELKPDQKDEDSLPPYPVLDHILQGYLDEGKSQSELVAEGLNPETVAWVIKTLWRNEYKRRQAAPALKVTSKAFGMGRRMPIATQWPE